MRQQRKTAVGGSDVMRMTVWSKEESDSSMEIKKGSDRTMAG